MRRLLSLLLCLLFLTTTLRGAAVERPHCGAHDRGHAGMDGMPAGHGGHAGGTLRADVPTHDCPHCPATACHSTASCGGLNGGVSTLGPPPFAASGRNPPPRIGVAGLHSRSVRPTPPPPRDA